MTSIRKIFKRVFLSIVIVLSVIVGVVILVNVASQHSFHIPPCEAMRPYIEYHGTTYFAVYDGNNLTSSDLGQVITTTGDGANQAKSCMGSGVTVYSVKGYPITNRLAADFGGLRLFEPYRSTPTPSSSASPAKP